MNDVTTWLDGRPIRAVETGIWSVLPADTPGQLYDSRARAYDRMIGSRLYNRLLWGTSPTSYRAFARQAVASSGSGWLLDAGCGTMLLTAEAYAAAPQRPVLAIDQSLGMLRRAKARVAELGATNVTFLQADLRDLPLRDGVFSTVLSMGMVHLFDDAGRVLCSLGRVVALGGGVWVTSLVKGRPVGDAYLRVLQRAGEVAAPRSVDELSAVLRESLGRCDVRVEGSMAYVHCRVERQQTLTAEIAADAEN